MRPLDRPVSGGGVWTAPTTLDFTASEHHALVSRVFGTVQPGTSDCLELLDDHVSGKRLLNPDEALVASEVRRKVNATYRAATPYLLDALGSYCAYCELPMHDPVQLEHVLPKAQYPTFALTWGNFLPACIGCNSRKGDIPLRAATAQALDLAVATPEECRMHIRSVQYRWPDLDALEGHIDIHLQYRLDGAWHQCPPASSVHESTRRLRTSIVDGEVRATIPQENLDDVAVAAVVAVVDGFDVRSVNTVDLIKLGKYPQPLDSADRRTIRRTETWFAAVDVLNRLRSLGIPPSPPPDVTVNIRSGGFWRTWKSVADALDPALGQLVREAAACLNGTDKTRL